MRQASISQTYKKCKPSRILQCVQKTQVHEYSYKTAKAEAATEKWAKGQVLFSVSITSLNYSLAKYREGSTVFYKAAGWLCDYATLQTVFFAAYE